MQFKAVHDRVVVKPRVVEAVTPGGIVLSSGAVEKPAEGIVITTGPGRRTKDGVVIPISVKEGDRVLYFKGAGQTVKIEGEEVLILKEEEIYAVVEDGVEFE